LLIAMLQASQAVDRGRGRIRTIDGGELVGRRLNGFRGWPARWDARFSIPCAWKLVVATLRLNKHNRQELGGDQTSERQCAQEIFHRLTSAMRSYYRILVTERPGRERLKFATSATSTQW
jgi:hypothetical protein